MFSGVYGASVILPVSMSGNYRDIDEKFVQ